MRSVILASIVASAFAGSASRAEAANASADPSAVVRGNNAFAFALHDQLRDREGNLFYSPFSVSTALAMTYAGARSQTADQMAAAMRFAHTDERLHAAFKTLLAELSSPREAEAYRLHVANALWMQIGSAFLPEFLAIGRGDYHAALESLDMAGAPEAARQRINSWVEKQTAQKIKDLIPEGYLGGLSPLVLTNAIYFKGNWAAKFQVDRTRDDAFTRPNGGQVQVPMMRQTGDFRLFENDQIQVLEAPYVGKDLSMIILLPRIADGLPAVEKGLTLERVNRWLEQSTSREVHFGLPRFKVTSEIRLDTSLQAMGMVSAFGRQADFSGMTGSRGLCIGAVFHKAFVDTNEEGTEAAAATGVIMKRTSVQRPARFWAAHPFMFLIRHAETGSILFVGRVADPSA